jgi:hypothetical protein
MEYQHPKRTTSWFYLRAILALAMIPSSASGRSLQVSDNSFLIVLLGGLVICAGLAIYLYLVCDKSYKDSIADLFLFGPVFPTPKCASALWVFLGNLVFIGGLAALVHDSLRIHLIQLNVSICIVGLCIVGTVLIVRHQKRHAKRK